MHAFSRLLAVVAVTLATLCGAFAGGAQAAALKTVRYHGYSVTVPRQWPVIHVGQGSTTCVRFNRHAVYLGTPSTDQRCPAQAAGRTEAILVSPRPATASAVTADVAHASATPAAAQPSSGSETQLQHGSVSVTATWAGEPATIRRALRLRALPRGHAAASILQMSPRSAAETADVKATTAKVPHSTGTVYTGKAFDACSTPSNGQMNAWGSSPYRGLGVYIGGANSACAQPNLNSAWMANEWAAGWHVIPIYVGLQAPSNSCGCAAISTSQAASEGTAAATDAVAHAQAVGIGVGNPIYFDMEAYSRTSANTTAVTDFLAAWTNQLHADGYGSGVYSSTGSGVADLVARYGTTYPEPDDIWVADWNGQATANDSSLPSGDWADHQRLHQYSGAHNETYGGTTINIDSDYVDGATAFGVATAAAAPSLSVDPQATGTVNLYAGWAGVSGISSWQTLGGSTPTTLSALDSTRAGGGSTTIGERSVFPYYAVQAIGSSGQVLGTSATVAARPHVAIYGHSVFVPSTGPAGVPAGCFTGSACRMSLTVYAGRRLIASTGAEQLAPGAGIVFFKLSTAGRRLLASARSHRLAVSVTAKDVSGRSAKTNMNLIPYTTAGRGPGLSTGTGGGVHFLGRRDFVYRSHTGGILAGCSGSAPCTVKVTISAGRQTVATTGPEVIGANSASYLSYRLTGYGAGLVAAAKGNQLGATVTVADQAGTARGHLALLNYR